MWWMWWIPVPPCTSHWSSFQTSVVPDWETYRPPWKKIKNQKVPKKLPLRPIWFWHNPIPHCPQRRPILCWPPYAGTWNGFENFFFHLKSCGEIELPGFSLCVNCCHLLKINRINYRRPASLLQCGHETKFDFGENHLDIFEVACVSASAKDQPNPAPENIFWIWKCAKVETNRAPEKKIFWI